MVRLFALWMAALLLPGCAVLRLTWPPALDGDTPVVVAGVGHAPKRDVEIVFDLHGVPHVFAKTQRDAAYGLGFAHARDRLFQIEVLRFAAQGRLTELFGRDLLDVDRQLRLLTWRLDEAVQALSARDRALIEAYVNGVNAGALHAGRPLEMHILGRTFIPMTVRDVVAVMRLRAWNHAKGLVSELAHARVVMRLPASSPVRTALLQPVSTGGVALSASGEASIPPLSLMPAPVKPNDAKDGAKARIPVIRQHPGPRRTQRTTSQPMELARLLPGVLDRGASGAWVVSGKHTLSGAPILVGDPHLRHTAPSVFYLAHLHWEGGDVVGATYPGIPAVLEGFTPDFAWTLTTSYADTQDLVHLSIAPDGTGRYLDNQVPPQAQPFQTQSQRYLASGEVIHTETWAETGNGLVLPPGYGYLVEPGESYALHWTGFLPQANQNNVSAYWDLASTQNLNDLNAAAAKMGVPSQNLFAAFQSGDIAWRLLGDVPMRFSKVAAGTPQEREGDPTAWGAMLRQEDKPHLDNPPSGVLFCENQRILNKGDPHFQQVGLGGALPWRARRLKERLDGLLAGGKKVGPDALVALENDVHSVEARELAPLLGASCPSTLGGFSDVQLQTFCRAVVNFDARYVHDSRGALVFTRVLDAFVIEVLSAHLGTDVARQLSADPAIRGAVEHAILLESRGGKSPLLNDSATDQHEGVRGFMRRATEDALGDLVDNLSPDPSQWRWGKVHQLKVRGALAQTAAVGSFYEGVGTVQDGHSETLRAESGTPIQSGSVLRFVVQLEQDVQGRMVLDRGQSGHKQHPHERDQFAPWNSVAPFAIAIRRDEIKSEGSLVIKAHRSP